MDRAPIPAEALAAPADVAAGAQRRLTRLPSADEFLRAAHKRVCLIGMSGVGKTTLARRLRAASAEPGVSGGWFHYSVDYRIGTRYMGEHIVDSFKREAMNTPMLRDLLMTDSIYIASNITFDNLAPLSTYLGKPGDPDRGGLRFEEYLRRQRQHREAEVAAMHDAAAFIAKARDIYGYAHFLCDASGSFVEICDADDPDDPVLRAATDAMLLVYIRQAEGDAEELARRFEIDPKPMYYEEAFLHECWRRYLSETGAAESDVDPDAFARWGFRALLAHRTPRYRAIAERWGVTLEKDEVADAADEAQFIELVAAALQRAAPAN